MEKSVPQMLSTRFPPHCCSHTKLHKPPAHRAQCTANYTSISGSNDQVYHENVPSYDIEKV